MTAALAKILVAGGLGGLREGDPMVSFTAVNGRTAPVSLFSVRSTEEEKLEGELQPGAVEQYTAPEGEVWVARDAGRIVAVYKVTLYVPQWAISPADTGFAVDLQVQDAGDFNESLAPNGRFLAASGTIRAVMLFVDFDGDEASGQRWSDEKEIVKRVVGDADAELQKVSFGALELVVTPVTGWRRMPKRAAAYADPSCGCASSGLRLFIEDAAALYGSRVDFSQYDVVYVVAAKSDDFRLSPAWIAERNDPIKPGTGEVRYAVAFGKDSYDPQNKTFLLLHETYHLLGLPDLYDGGAVSGKGYSKAGLEKWDLMASQRGDSDLLAWHRLKLGWLHPSQVICLYGSGPVEVDLADWAGPEGVKAVMVAVTMRRAVADASLAYVAEAAVSRGRGQSPGVLVYSVNAAFPTWERPIQMRGGSDALSAEPLTVGKSFTHLNGVGVTVLKRRNSGFRVRVEKG